MDPGKNDLPISLLGKEPYLLLHVLRSAAPHASAGVGNDTVAAELVAAILNLYKSAGVICLSGNMKGLIFVCC